MKRVHLYSLYERVWHWLQAGTILALLLTGLAIHAPASVPWLHFARATALHEALAVVTIANAFLSLFHHLATGLIRHYLPSPRDFFTLALAQARHYLWGIFVGAPHPFERSSERKLNALQQVTYLAILNVLLPTQIVTGILMWKAGEWSALVNALGGLAMIAAIHTLAAWSFIAFLVMHVYLTTTGHTPTSLLRAMFTGYELVDDHPPAAAPKEKTHEH